MNRLIIILTALIITLSASAQSIDNSDQVPKVAKNQHFTFIDTDGYVGSDESLELKFDKASLKLHGDAVCIVSKVPVYDGFEKDFYKINNFDTTCGIVILVDRKSNSANRFCLFGSLQGKGKWVEKRYGECYDYDSVKTLGDFYKALADSLCAVIGEIEIPNLQEENKNQLNQDNKWAKYEIAKRTTSDPKINKSFIKDNLTKEQLQLALITPYVDTSVKVYDAAGLLDNDEIAELQTNIHNFINKYNFDMVVVTINENNKKPGNGNIATENYAMDFYEYNNFGKGKQDATGYDGVILVIDMQNRKFSILDVGTPNNKWRIAINNVGKYISAMAPDLTGKNYCKAINTFIDSYSTDCEYFVSLKPNDWSKYVIGQRSEENPQVHKSFLCNNLTKKQLERALQMPYVDTEIKVYDAAGLLSNREYSAIKSRVDEFINKNKIDMVIVTINQNDEETNLDNNATENFAMDFYEYNDFGKGEQSPMGYDGVILVIDMQNRKFSILDAGMPNNKLRIAKDNLYNYTSQMTPLMKNKNYSDAIIKFINLYEIDYQYEISFPWKKCLFYSLIIALIFYIREKKKYSGKIRRASTAVEYGLKFRLTQKTSKLIKEYTTEKYSPRETYSSSSSSSRSSYRSSGSSHRSSSGRSFGGGSGSF